MYPRRESNPYLTVFKTVASTKLGYEGVCPRKGSNLQSQSIWAPDFESGAYANSATGALGLCDMQDFRSRVQ